MVWKELTRAQLDETKEFYAANGYAMQFYAMAVEVLLTMLGPSWYRKNLVVGASKSDSFLCSDGVTESARYEHQERVIRLGHMLYGLKDKNGFGMFLEKLQTRDLGPVFFELWVAWSLSRSGFTVSFVSETGEKKKDYDLIVTKDECTIRVEAKSRRANVILSERTLDNALRAARKQFPDDGPCIIFVWVPVEWTQASEVDVVVGGVIESFFRETTRINSVVVLWEKWTHVSTLRAKAIMARQYDNPASKFIMPPGKLIQTIDDEIHPTAGSFVPAFW